MTKTLAFPSARQARDGLFRLRPLALLLAATFGPSATTWAAGPAANALPTGGQVAAGQASLVRNGSTLTVLQGTPQLITNWQTFDIGRNASVVFVQPSASASALNRVLSADPSQIFGQLSANGSVVLVNPSGVLFGPSARIDVGSLMASSLQLSDADFLARQFRFTDGGRSGQVQNLGRLAAREGGFIALVGGAVNNAGEITAPGGQVALAAGQTVQLGLGDAGLITVNVQGGERAARIDNSGLIAADGGKVWLTARSAAPALASAVNNTGTLRADTLAQRDGQIWIEAGGGDTTLGGSVLARGTADGERGGRIVATGQQVTLAAGGMVDASGAAGGGTVRVGGGWQGKDPVIAQATQVVQEAGNTVRADATVSGDGGTAVLWSGEATRMAGTVSARGAGTGLGGQVETSSRGSLDLSGRVDTGSASGDGGKWLLDPYNLTVGTSAGSQSGSAPTFSATGTGAKVQASSIEAALNNGTNVTLSTGASGSEAGNISIEADIAKTAGGNAKLTFDAAKDITLAKGKSISSIVGALDIDFGTTTAVDGTALILGSLATNGGTVHFYKATTLASATPVSTKITQPSSGQSGDIVFHRDVVLAAPGYSVALDTSAPQAGATFTGRGGTISFMGDIASGTPASQIQSPQSLSLDTSSGSGLNPGDIILGSASTNRIGGTGEAGLRSLVLSGPTTVQLKAGTVNLRNTSGTVLSASTNQPESAGSTNLAIPRIELQAPNTVINVTGGAVAGLPAGFADYRQETFDISTAADGAARTLAINADRTIRVRNRSIAAGGTGSLDVTLNPFEASSAVGGAVILDNATLQTNGGAVRIGRPAGNTTQYAVGFGGDEDGVTDGVLVKNTRIVTNGGDIEIRGRAPDTTAAGAGVRMSGARTELNTGSGTITVEGRVDAQTTAGNKDAVILGEGGASRVTLRTTSGQILVSGDASGVGSNPSGGSRYDGVVISSRSLLQTDSGDIRITGTGGGGDQVYLQENHGIKLEDSQTSVISATGAIQLTGTSGGKTSATQGENSFGIYAKGNTMSLGSGTGASGGAVNATGNITLTADSMEFANSSSFHLSAASAGELRIQSKTASRDVDVVADPSAAVDKLYLGSDWFNGTGVAIFQPGFGSQPGATGAVTIGRSDATGRTSVSSATTLRDDTTLLGGTGAFALNQGLTVQGAAAAGRTLTIDTAGSVSATGAVTADRLLLLGSGAGQDVAFTGNNQIGTLAANVNGRLSLDNTQALTVGSVSSTRLGTARSATGVTTSNDDLTLKTRAGNLTLAESVAIGTGKASLSAVEGAVLENAGKTVTADGLFVQSAKTSVLDQANQVKVLAADLRDEGLLFRNAQALEVGRVAVTPLTANADGSVTAGTAVNKDGIAATHATEGNVKLQVSTGDLTQSAAGDIRATGLLVQMDQGAATLENTTNRIGTLAADIQGTGKALSVKTRDGLTVGSVAVRTAAGATTLASLEHVTTRNGDVRLAASSDAATAGGDLQLARNVDTGAAGSATVRLSAGKGTVLETGQATVRADQLHVAANATGRVASLNNDNDVRKVSATLTGADHSLVLRDVGALQVLGIDGNDGVQVTGNATLVVKAGDLTQAANGTGDVRAAGLLVRADAGAVTLENSANEVGVLAADLRGAGQALKFKDRDGFEVGAVSTAVTTQPDAGATTVSASGITTAGGDVNLVAAAGSANAPTSDDLRLTQLVSTGGTTAGTVRLDSVRGSVSSSGNGRLLTQNLLATSQTGVVLDNVDNDVATAAGRVRGTGVFELSDRNALTVGRVNDAGGQSVDGVRTADGNLRVSASRRSDAEPGDLSLTESLAAGGTGRTLQLEALRGKVTETANVNLDADRLLLTARDTSTLENESGSTAGSHRINTLAARITGVGQAFGFRNEGALAIGTVTGQESTPPAATVGVATASGDIQIATRAGTVTLGKDVVAGADSRVDVRAGGAGADVVFDGAALRSGATGTGAGTVQVVAGRDIRTTAATDGTAEIATAGSVLLQAGGAIGSDPNRIELAGAQRLSSRSAGNQWLRKLGASDALEVGSVAAINAASSLGGGAGTFGGAVASLSGLSTTANGSIALTTQGGNLDVAQAVRADGSGTIDLRTGATGDVRILNDAGRAGVLASGTGQVQVLAGGALTASSATGTATEIATAGNVLLSAGKGIGADGQRVELAGVSTLAAESAGPQWLRQGTGALTVGAVTALTPAANTLDRTAADKAGLVTTTADSGIALTVAAGNLTVARNVVAAGNGSIDLRTGARLVLDGATLTSGASGTGTGTVQLLAGGDIATTSPTGTVDEIATAGKVLIDSAGAIGQEGQRIELAGVSTLAARSNGGQWLRQRTGSLEVGAVTALKPTDSGATDLAGLLATGGPIVLTAVDGGLLVSRAVDAGTADVTLRTQGTNGAQTLAADVRGATVTLDSAQGISQTDGALRAAQARVLAGADASLTRAGNSIGTLAARTGGPLGVTNAGALVVGSVQTTAGTDAAGRTDGVSTADKSVFLRTVAGALTVNSAVDAGRGEATLQTRAGGQSLAANLRASTLTLDSANGIVQTGGTVSADQLRVLAGASASLGATGNQVKTLAAQLSAGDFSYAGSNGIVLGQVSTAVGNAGVGSDSTGTTAGIRTPGDVSLRAVSGDLSQVSGSSLQAAKGRLQADAGQVDLSAAGNNLGQVAGAATGRFTLLDDAGSLAVGTVQGATGITAGGPVWVRSRGDLSLEGSSAVKSTSATANAVTLVADQAFRNNSSLQGQAVQAPGGRWLIYDDNALLENRLGGLAPQFTRLDTSYDAYPVASVLETGNGYLTTARNGNPEQFSRALGGASSASVPTGQVATAYTFQVQGVPVADIGGFVGTVPVLQPNLAATPSFGVVAGAPLPALQLPIRLSVTPGQTFRSALAPLIGSGSIESVSLGDGSAAPAWLVVDPEGLTLSGRAPQAMPAVLDLLVTLRDAGTGERRQVRIQVTQAGPSTASAQR